MGAIEQPTSVLLLIAVSSRHEEALAWAEKCSTEQLGPLRLKSVAFDFTETDYYTSTMGSGLKKQFLAFERLIDPGELAAIKCRTNHWEAEYAGLGRQDEPRPLNLDPGYLTLAKLVLASTKDHAHRIYLGQGIYAEFTLQFRRGGWQACEWTYPDYRRGDYQEFFSRCRVSLRG
jgi:Domain of unknown function (DUF4416)